MVHDPSLFVSVSEHLDGVPLLILPPLTVCPSTLVAKQPFRLAERLRAAFSSFVVTNSSDRAIRLVPLSNINLIVVFGAKRDLDDSEKVGLKPKNCPFNPICCSRFKHRMLWRLKKLFMLLVIRLIWKKANQLMFWCPIQCQLD